MAIGLGIGLKFGGAITIDSQAQGHFNRVVADGGTIPAGLAGCDAWFKAVKGVYGVSDITSAISSGIHPHYLGYKLGAGSGATLGSAAQTCYNAIGATGDVVQTTAASQPLILPHTGTNYVWLPGVSGNNFTTPNAAANIISGNLELTAYNIRWSGSASNRYLISKTDTYSLSIATSNSLTLEYRIGGSVLVAASTSTISTSFSGSVRVFRNSTTGEVTFYTSTDNINFTQLGSVVVGTSGVISNLTNSIFVGSYNSTIATWQGSIGRATIATSLGGNPVVDFNPANYSRATNGTTWTSTTGEVWTINTPSTNNALKAAIVDTTYLMGNGTSIGMRAASLSMNQTGIASYTAIRKFVNTGAFQVITELGADTGSSQGRILFLAATSNSEAIGINSNVGFGFGSFTSTSLALKLITGVNDITLSNDCTPYLVNNVAQTPLATPLVNNTTAVNPTGYNFLARNNASSNHSNIMLACDIVSKNADSTGTQTSMYSALKPFLVNAI